MRRNGEQITMNPSPLFIVGVGRSGSSVFHRLMCRHPRAAWLSRVLEHWPNAAPINRVVMHALALPGVGHSVSRMIDPGECYEYWEQLAPGFARACRDLVAADVQNDVLAQVRRALAQVPTKRRPQLVAKVTGWPRIGFLREIFPNAKFIHVVRDGRAVAASLLKVDWWQGWRGPSGWLFGELTAEHMAEWHRHDRSFVALAGIQWKILMDAMERARQSVPTSCMVEIEYEDLCRDPLSHFRRVAEFAELEWVPEFERAIRSAELRSENEKWRRYFTPSQQSILESVLRSHLVRYGYEPQMTREPVEAGATHMQMIDEAEHGAATAVSDLPPPDVAVMVGRKS